MDSFPSIVDALHVRDRMDSIQRFQSLRYLLHTLLYRRSPAFGVPSSPVLQFLSDPHRHRRLLMNIEVPHHSLVAGMSWDHGTGRRNESRVHTCVRDHSIQRIRLQYAPSYRNKPFGGENGTIKEQQPNANIPGKQIHMWGWIIIIFVTQFGGKTRGLNKQPKRNTFDVYLTVGRIYHGIGIGAHETHFRILNGIRELFLKILYNKLLRSPVAS